ncbi:MAG: hypothetical protein JWP31_2310, partial [Aeromicrobium sp.]|nr:hypothetical protein [Aeromicrobium sp.]
ERTGWRSSRFSQTSAPVASDRRALRSSGVRLATCATRTAAASMLAAVAGGGVGVVVTLTTLVADGMWCGSGAGGLGGRQ